MLVKTKAIVLHKIKYSNSSLIVNLYTEEWGKQSILVRGVLSKKSKINSSYLDYMNIIEIEAWKGKNSDLLVARDVQLAYHTNSISESLLKKTIAVYMSELLYRTINVPDADKELFDFVCDAVHILDSEEYNQHFPILFLIKLLHFLGISPINNFDHRNKIFDMRTSKFIPDFNDINYCFDAETSRILSIYLNVQNDYSVDENIGRRERNQVLDDVLKYLTYHYSYFKGLKSLEVLKSVLS